MPVPGLDTLLLLLVGGDTVPPLSALASKLQSVKHCRSCGCVASGFQVRTLPANEKQSVDKVFLCQSQ